MGIYDLIESRIIGKRGAPGLEGVPYPSLSNPGAFHVELTPQWYIASLPGDASAIVKRPPVETAMTPAYAALVARSEQLHKRLGDIADELIALQVPSVPTWDHVAELVAGTGYTAPDFADVEIRAKGLDLEAQHISHALPQLAHQAREQAKADAETMRATARAAYVQADSAHAEVEAAALAKRQAAEAAYAAALDACEAMQVATRSAFTGAAWSLAWAEGLPNTTTADMQHARAMELSTTARPSLNPAPAVEPQPSQEELQAAMAHDSWRKMGRARGIPAADLPVPHINSISEAPEGE